MAINGQSFLLLALMAAATAAEGRTATAQSASYSAAGHVVMPHPGACACNNEEKSHREKLWDKLRPGCRERYVTQQHVRHLHHPECPPYCMENFGYYQTCWRRFPEQTLGCRYCWDGSSPPLPAAPLPTPTAPAPAPFATPAPAPSPPPALPSPSPGELTPVPPLEYDTPPAAEPEIEDVQPTITPTGAWWKDPAWQAGLSSNSPISETSDRTGTSSVAVSRSPQNLNDPTWKAGLRSAR